MASTPSSSSDDARRREGGEAAIAARPGCRNSALLEAAERRGQPEERSAAGEKAPANGVPTASSRRTKAAQGARRGGMARVRGVGGCSWRAEW